MPHCNYNGPIGSRGKVRAGPKKETSRSKFPDRIVLGVGCPWSNPWTRGPFAEVSLCDTRCGIKKKLKWPAVLWHPELPEYRLVLERVYPRRKGHGKA